jgi:hypothetical protein
MLTGKLVRLRPIEMTDVDRYFAWIGDADVIEFLGTRLLNSMTQEEEYVRLATQQIRAAAGDPRDRNTGRRTTHRYSGSARYELG